jgi:hypothetical protein
MSTKSQPIFFARQSYPSTAPQLSPQRLINMYAESVPQDVKGKDTRYVLYNSQGLKLWKDLDTFSTTYAMQKMGDNLYVVAGLSVYKIDSTKTETLLGTLTGSPGAVKLSNNGTQMTIIDSIGKGFIATLTTFTAITDPDFPTATDVTFIDGYTIVSEQSTGKYYISAINDSSSWNALDFGVAESEPDKLVGITRFNGQLWLFGTDTIEVHYNSGNPDFPFERINGATQNVGCIARDSIAQDDKYLCWLGSDKLLYMSTGYQGSVFSTKSVAGEILGYSRVDNAYSFIYTQDGHKFYSITFPTARKTWEYDITEGLWHERESIEDNTIYEWRAISHELFAGKNLIGDFKAGSIYEMDTDTFKEGDFTMVATAISKVLYSNTNRFVLHRLQLDMEMGIGTITGQGTNPQIMLQVSKNGGKTYGTELWRDLGELGDYKNRAVWRQLGICREVNFKIKISDPVRRALLGGYIDYEQMEP